jgi:hypothetical protein
VFISYLQKNEEIPTIVTIAAEILVTHLIDVKISLTVNRLPDELTGKLGFTSNEKVKY